MEDKIEIGEYVRFENGKIRKIIGIDKDNHYCVDINYKGAEYLTVFEVATIIKHSSNIIDIIEEGDYVNGEQVLCFRNKDCNYDIGTEYSDDWGEYFGVDEEDIKNILTHEQYEADCYRLED